MSTESNMLHYIDQVAPISLFLPYKWWYLLCMIPYMYAYIVVATHNKLLGHIYFSGQNSINLSRV